MQAKHSYNKNKDAILRERERENTDGILKNSLKSRSQLRRIFALRILYLLCISFKRLDLFSLSLFSSLAYRVIGTFQQNVGFFSFPLPPLLLFLFFSSHFLSTHFSEQPVPREYLSGKMAFEHDKILLVIFCEGGWVSENTGAGRVINQFSMAQ